MKKNAATIKLPNEIKISLYFERYHSRPIAHYVIYFDFESLIKIVATYSNSSDRKQSEITDTNEPCGYCWAVLEHSSPEHVPVKLDRSSNCMQRFVENLERLAKGFYEMMHVHWVHNGSPRFSSDQWWICENDSTVSERILQQCHGSRKFRVFAHGTCILKRRTVNHIPIFAHNLS